MAKGQVLTILKELRIGGNMWTYTKNVLINREFSVNVGNTFSSYHCLQNNISKGSLTIFLIAINGAEFIIMPLVKIFLHPVKVIRRDR